MTRGMGGVKTVFRVNYLGDTPPRRERIVVKKPRRIGGFCDWDRIRDTKIRGGNENARSADEMGVSSIVSRIDPLERNSRVIGGREGSLKRDPLPSPNSDFDLGMRYGSNPTDSDDA
jgi:hypothetical protein